MHKPDQPARQRILFGTNNQAKIEIIQAFLETLPIALLIPADLDIHVSVREDGRSPEENAEKKARAYFAAARIPTFALDAALSVQELPPEKQPGTYVRRISKTDEEASDREMLDYYIHELDQVGGISLATWSVAIAFIAEADQVFVQRYDFQTKMVSKASPKLLPGAPLSSLMIDPRTGKYLSETDHRERIDADWVKSFVQENLARIQ